MASQEIRFWYCVKKTGIYRSLWGGPAGGVVICMHKLRDRVRKDQGICYGSELQHLHNGGSRVQHQGNGNVKEMLKGWAWEHDDWRVGLLVPSQFYAASLTPAIDHWAGSLRFCDISQFSFYFFQCINLIYILALIYIILLFSRDSGH